MFIALAVGCALSLLAGLWLSVRALVGVLASVRLDLERGRRACGSLADAVELAGAAVLNTIKSGLLELTRAVDRNSSPSAELQRFADGLHALVKALEIALTRPMPDLISPAVASAIEKLSAALGEKGAMDAERLTRVAEGLDGLVQAAEKGLLKGPKGEDGKAVVITPGPAETVDPVFARFPEGTRVQVLKDGSHWHWVELGDENYKLARRTQGFSVRLPDATVLKGGE